MKRTAHIFLALACTVTAAQGQDTRAPVLVEYPFLCPSCEEPHLISVRYGSDGTSILETHKQANTPQVAPANDGSTFLPGEWLAGPMTDFQPGRIQHWEDEVGTNFIEVQPDPALQDGIRYVDRRLTLAADAPGQASWSIGNVDVALVEGTDDREIHGLAAEHMTATLAYTRTEYNADGAETSREQTTHRYDLWVSDALPFSPLPLKYEPFVGNRVRPLNGGPVGARLMAALAPRLEPHGGLLRAEITTDGQTAAIEAQTLRATPEPPMEKFATLPVVGSEQVGLFAGPLFIASMLRAEMLSDTPTARFNLDGREVEAVSAWKTNDSGDLVIVLSAVDENSSLFLSRPVNGIPEPGKHEGTRKAPFSELRGMDEQELATYTGRFQLNGVITNSTLPTVLTGFENGTVTIDAIEGETISGSVSGSVSALSTETISQPQTLPVEIAFEAARGLQNFGFRSEASRVAR